jgi:YHS domain-containing protein
MVLACATPAAGHAGWTNPSIAEGLELANKDVDMKSIVRLSLVAALWATSLVCGLQATSGQDQIPWAADFQQAAATADQQRRLVLIHFYSDDCPPCVVVDQQVFSQPHVAAAVARNYVPVKVHVKQAPELAARYHVRSWPTDVFVTPAGLEVFRTTSPQVAAQYVALVDQVAARAGIGMGRQWADNMAAVGQATLGSSQTTAQNHSERRQQAFNQTASQPGQSYQPTTAPSGDSSFQMSPQAQEAASQFGQQTQTAVNQYRQQGETAVEQYQQQAGAAVQQFQQQAPDAQQQFVGAAGQFREPPRSSATQWQAGMSPADLRSPLSASSSAATTSQAMLPPATSPQQQIRVHDPAVPTSNPWLQVQHRQQTPPQTFVPASQAPPIAMDGYCPVTLIEDMKNMKWKKGDPQFGAIHRGKTYLFASVAHQQKFLADPDAYSPMLSGCDPVRFATTGERVDGKRAYGLTFGNRIYLFADEASLNQFAQTPRAFADTAHQATQRSETGGTLYR